MASDVFVHPFRDMVRELYAVADQLAGITDDHEPDGPRGWDTPEATTIRRVADELVAVANALDITHTKVPGSTEWSRDVALRVALDSIADLVERHGVAGRTVIL